VKHSISLWIIALLVTVVAAYYQRVTGPSYPFTGTAHFNEKDVGYSLPRSHGGSTPALIEVQTGDSTFRGFVEWKRYKTEDSWTRTKLINRAGNLTAELPHQPPSGKLEYRVALYRGDEIAIVPGDAPLIIRFKGDVPAMILIPHIIAMFASMLLAARTGLEYFNEKSNLRALTYWTIGFIVVGGFIFGPMVQYYAFDAWWTGWPLGTDLTDNKTAIALLAWVGVVFALGRSRKPQLWAIAASIITFAVFLIPHSLLGSELDYEALDRQDVKTDSVVTR
jgi:hypothetical protein